MKNEGSGVFIASLVLVYIYAFLVLFATAVALEEFNKPWIGLLLYGLMLWPFVRSISMGANEEYLKAKKSVKDSSKHNPEENG